MYKYSKSSINTNIGQQEHVMGELISMDNWKQSHPVEFETEIQNSAQAWTLREMLVSIIKDIDNGVIHEKAVGMVLVDAGDDIMWNNAKLNQEDARELLMDVLANHIEDEDLEEL